MKRLIPKIDFIFKTLLILDIREVKKLILSSTFPTTMADFVNDKTIDDKEEKEEAGEGDDNAPAPVSKNII
jgi:hypothetical protein